MKKTFLTLIALFAALQFSFAQWSTSGSNTIHTNSGNVGIGATSPGHKLTVHLASGTGNVISWGNAGGGYYGSIGFDSNGSYLSNFAGNAAIYLNGSTSNVGIGTIAPTYKLEVAGGIGTRGIMGNLSTGQYFEAIPYEIASHNNAGWAGTMLGVRSGGLNGSSVPLTQNLTASAAAYQQAWAMTFGTDKDQTNGAAFSLWTGDATTASTAMSEIFRIKSNGSVGIGTTDPRGYKLAVNGDAIATSMTVKLYSNWPDFVFLKDYKLPALSEVKTYIDKNQHLPDMPSADEVHKNGLDLGEMNRLLLKKVEELTLYLMEEHKKNAEQENRIKVLETALKTNNNNELK